MGAVGGRVLGHGMTIGGRMSAQGKVYYEGLPRNFSGNLHRAALTQSAEAVDIRCMQVRKECWELFEQTVGVPYLEKEGMFDVSALPADTDYRAVSLKFCKALKEDGYGILYDPERTIVWK